MNIWTIGHSNHSLDEFLDLLLQHEIKVLADIRRFPSSRTFPHFNQDNLSQSLTAVEIEYRWLEGLGGRRPKMTSESPSPNEGWRNKSFRNYADYMMTPAFRETFSVLAGIADKQRTAIMCSESVFWRCHRRLVSDYVIACGGSVQHIFPGGQAKPHSLTDAAVVVDRSDDEPNDQAKIIYPREPTLFD